MRQPIAHSLTPDAAGNWTTTTSVSPAPGRGVRVAFTAPANSQFAVSLRTPDGTATSVPQNAGTPAPPEAGYFQIMSVGSQSPPVYRIYVRAPITLSDPANYAVEIVNQSARTDVADSAPLVVGLRQRPIFTVTVRVTGAGRGCVISTPAGIQCGVSQLGTQLNDCSFDFPPGPVSLAANSNSSSRLIGWSGNCAPNMQVCNFALTGMSATAATATFGPSTAPVTPSTCAAAPAIPGLRWIDIPDCDAMTTGITRPARCDAQGYFCCAHGPTGSNAPRCGGTGQVESLAHCMHQAPRGLLRQPGGCYEVDTPP